MKQLDQLRELKAKGKIKRQFTQIGNEALIPGVLDKSIKFKYNICAEKGIPINSEPIELKFELTDEKYERFGIKRTDNLREIAKHNQDSTTTVESYHTIEIMFVCNIQLIIIHITSIFAS